MRSFDAASLANGFRTVARGLNIMLVCGLVLLGLMFADRFLGDRHVVKLIVLLSQWFLPLVGMAALALTCVGKLPCVNGAVSARMRQLLLIAVLSDCGALLNWAWDAWTRTTSSSSEFIAPLLVIGMAFFWAAVQSFAQQLRAGDLAGVAPAAAADLTKAEKKSKSAFQAFVLLSTALLAMIGLLHAAPKINDAAILVGGLLIGMYFIVAAIAWLAVVNASFALEILHNAIRQNDPPSSPGGRWIRVVGAGQLVAAAIVAWSHWSTPVVIQFATPGTSEAAQAGWVGKPMPAIELTCIDGRKLTAADFAGKRVILDFWATWCGPCREAIPHLSRLAKEEADLVVVGISNEDPAKLKKFAAENDVAYPLASATKLPAPFDGIDVLPTIFFVDKTRVIRHVAVGFGGPEELRAHLP